MKKLFAVCMIALCAFAVSAQAQNTNSDPYSQEVRKLMEVTKVKEAYAPIMEATLNAIVQQGSVKLPAGFNMKKFSMGAANDFFNLVFADMVKIYKKHYTLEDLKAVNAFYKTPAGKKFAEKTPVVSAEAAQLGSKYTNQMVQIIQRHMNQ